MLSKILPEYLNSIISNKLNYQKVYELRVRAAKPILVNYGGKYMHLTEEGVSMTASGAICADRKLVDAIIYKATEYSVYAVNGQIKNGFITVSGGIRIGICGELVQENNAVRTQKNYCGINIRIPHEVKNCSLNAFNHIVNKDIYNALIISPPGAGKTTFIRDLANNISMLSTPINILIVDERSEIAACSGGIPQLEVGRYTDVITNCTKEYGFSTGIRTMRPDVIITDELATEEDVKAAAYAISCGVKVIATTHAFDHLDLSLKPNFSAAMKNKLFDRFVVLSYRNGPGTYEGIYDSNNTCLYYP
ncbi:MAG: Flp pilus assembly complex ATPase component TadA [Clostridiales bacterium]|jgi:stage III sporulation protein AA|nr:Flp pilus assembly complex ATPase component TadA [Clostridiales bacterium]